MCLCSPLSPRPTSKTKTNNCMHAPLQMLIKGIRSFAPENHAAIEFYKPLTLIVGSNGAGKTVSRCRKRVSRAKGPRTHTLPQLRRLAHTARIGTCRPCEYARARMKGTGGSKQQQQDKKVGRANKTWPLPSLTAAWRQACACTSTKPIRTSSATQRAEAFACCLCGCRRSLSV
jgi:hypothetical protein